MTSPEKNFFEAETLPAEIPPTPDNKRGPGFRERRKEVENSLSGSDTEQTLSPKDVELILRERRVEVTKDLNGGINGAKFVKFENDGGGIWKFGKSEGMFLFSDTLPFEKEFQESFLETLPQEEGADAKKFNTFSEISMPALEPRERIPKGTYYLREVAAYAFDRALDLGIVPPTVLRIENGDEGSVQQFIPNARMGIEVPFSEISEEQMIALWLFDLIIWNTDRHESNYLVTGNSPAQPGNVHAIDNGLSFGHDSLRTAVDFIDVPIPPDIVQKFSVLFQKENWRTSLATQVKSLLPESDAVAALNRLEFIGRTLVEYGEISPETFDLIKDYDPVEHLNTIKENISK
jgi:hypothetical protein